MVTLGPDRSMNAIGTLLVPEPRLEIAGPDLWRVTASVAGSEVFFEASVPLSPRSEVAVCPFFLPAMARAMDLEIAGTLSAGFVDNLKFVQRQAMEWWPKLSGGNVRAHIGAPAPLAPDAALFYTGGADSSYLLQQLHSRVRYAVFVEGFDIELEDSSRLRSARAWLSATTRACGVELLVVRTNLREHPLFREVSWETTHIAALAAIAHVLGRHVHTMYVAASDVQPPWGSAPQLDAAWSSEAVRIDNFSAELTRLQRVASIARWEPLRGRLRVCWENNSQDLNCGFCEKCLRTRLQLYVSGAPDGLDSFPANQSLLATLGRLRSAEHELHAQWREAVAGLTDPRLRREVERILQGRPQPLWRRGLRRLKRNLERVVRLGAS